MGFGVDIVAVLVASVVSMILGMLWYSPVMFGNQWAKLQGWSKKDMKKAKKDSMTKPMILGFIATLITAYVLALFIGPGGNLGYGAQIAFYAWLGFVATGMLNSVLWEKKPFQLYVINVTYSLVSLFVMGLIIAAM